MMSDSFTEYALPSTPIGVATWIGYINEHVVLINRVLGRTIASIHDDNWTAMLRDAYNLYDDTLSFHNHRHILEVFQLGICLLSKNRNVLRKVSSTDLRTFVLATILHDAGHIGLSNDQITNALVSIVERNDNMVLSTVLQYKKYEITDNDPGSSSASYTSSYNESMHADLGRTVLEEHHIEHNSRLFAKLIYETDLSQNDRFIKNHISYNPFYGNQIPTEQAELSKRVLSLLLKIADIGHIVRPLSAHMHYAMSIHVERYSTPDMFGIPSDTIYFNETYVRPLLELLRDVNIGLSVKLLKMYNTNLQYWKSVERFAQKAKELSRDLD